jgi:hypothetical protein
MARNLNHFMAISGNWPKAAHGKHPPAISGCAQNHAFSARIARPTEQAGLQR